MVKNYIKVALRYLLRNPVYSSINIIGLALGVAASLLIFIYIRYEMSYDNFHSESEQIYRMRVEGKKYTGEYQFQSARNFLSAGPEIAELFDEVTNYVRVLTSETLIGFDPDDNPKMVFSTEDVILADSTFFEIFSFPIIYGNKETALGGSSKVLLSESYVNRFYAIEKGYDEIIGSIVSAFENDYIITGVFEDIPQNSHIKFDIVFSYPPAERSFYHDNWHSNIALTYLTLLPGTDPTELEKKFPAVLDSHKIEYFEDTQYREDFYLQALEDIHLTSHFEGEAEANGNKLSVQLLAFIAVLILVIAWINYINLSTARAVDRLREVGVRKANGANKTNLIIQFLLESFLVNLFSLILAYTIIQLTLPWYSQMVGVGVDALMAGKYLVWIILAILLVLGTIGAGAYPAFIMSSYKPALSLKTSAGGFKVQGLTLRKALVIFQFMTTVALIAGSLVIFNQISFMQNQKLGVNIDQTLIISSPLSLVGEDNFHTSVEIFKEKSLGITGISKASSSNFVPGMPVWGWGGYIRPVETERDAAKAYNPFQVDHDFLDYYQLDLIAGRTFSIDRSLDSTVVILTVASLKKLGYNSPEEAIGREIYFPINFNQNDIPREIIGVVQDYHQVSLHDSYLPIIFELNPNESRFFSLKVDGRELDKTISGINTVFTEVFGELPFDYFFLDEDFNSQYQQDKKFGLVLGIFTMFSVIIASMGLFGLASFSATKRTKEVGVRKVLGATAYSIFRLFSIEYLVLVLVASAIALPLTYFGSQLWLQEFAFNIELGWWFYILPLVAGSLLAIFSILYQILKTLKSNPVDLLRYE